jgi:hypothetical protein
MKRLGALVLAAAIAATFGIVEMSSANASTAHSVTITMVDGTTPGCNSTTVITTSTTQVFAAPGDTLSVQWDSTLVTGQNWPDEACGLALVATSAATLAGWSVRSPGAIEFQGLGAQRSHGLIGSVDGTGVVIFTVGKVSTTFSLYRSGPEPSEILALIFTVDVTIPTGSAPPDIVQQFAADETTPCISVPDSIELFNAPRSGGWSKSWAQWPNDGSGGFVCTRAVGYRPSIQGWLPRE